MIKFACRVRGTVFMESLGANHSGLMPANLITLAHFSVSSAMSLPKSAAEPAITSPPSSASRALILGSTRAALISIFELVDDFDRRLLGHAHTKLSTRLIARHEI